MSNFPAIGILVFFIDCYLHLERYFTRPEPSSLRKLSLYLKLSGKLFEDGEGDENSSVFLTWSVQFGTLWEDPIFNVLAGALNPKVISCQPPTFLHWGLLDFWY